MALDVILANLDLIAFIVLMICLTVSIIVRRRAGRPVKTPQAKNADEKYSHLFTHKDRIDEARQYQTSRGMRKAYRKVWAEKILEAKAYPEIRATVRNLIMTNTAFLSGVLVAFGLLATGFRMIDVNGGYPLFTMVSIGTLFVYALMMLISESRILNYIPIITWVDDEVIEALQGKGKIDYIANLLDDAFDRFSDSLRAIFYALICVFWLFNTWVFIAATIILTAIIIHSDTEKKLEITIF